jgi:transcriptional regulator with XRE-family HTH domain
MKNNVQSPVSRGNGLLFKIGEKLAQKLEETGTTKESLAAETGISRVTISNLLNGKLKNISVDTIERIAEGLGLKVEIIFLSE